MIRDNNTRNAANIKRLKSSQPKLTNIKSGFLKGLREDEKGNLFFSPINSTLPQTPFVRQPIPNIFAEVSLNFLSPEINEILDLVVSPLPSRYKFGADKANSFINFLNRSSGSSRGSVKIMLQKCLAYAYDPIQRKELYKLLQQQRQNPSNLK